MKRALTLIPIVGIFTTGILVSVPESAFAYCVSNETEVTIYAKSSSTKPWERRLKPGGQRCCSIEKECPQNVTITVTGPKGSSCEADVDARGSIVVYPKPDSNGLSLECKVE